MFFFLILLSLPLCFAEDSASTLPYSNYETVSEIPEPLIFDLVRPLGSKKGQWELNSLVQDEASTELNKVHISPEIEYMVLDGLGLELEAPMVGNEVVALKETIQYTLGSTGTNNQDIHGVQLINLHSISKDVKRLHLFTSLVIVITGIGLIYLWPVASITRKTLIKPTVLF